MHTYLCLRAAIMKELLKALKSNMFYIGHLKNKSIMSLFIHI